MSSYTEDDLYSPAKEYQKSPVEIGTVGWAGKPDYYSLGAGDNDGYTLVDVTLYRGRTPGKKPAVGVAEGYQIQCMIGSGMFRVPKPGTRCYVLFPAGFDETPGAAVIVATVEKSPTSQFASDRVVMDFGEDTHVVFRGKSVSLQDPDNRFLSVGTPRSGGAPGLTFQAADGSGGVVQEGVVSWFVAGGGDAKTVLQMTTDKVECTKKSGGYWTVDSDGFLAFGTNASLRASAVYLGSAPKLLTGVAYGSAGPVNTVSTGVFVSPV